jgi:peptide/nickel transport system substrate-binding protein
MTKKWPAAAAAVVVAGVAASFAAGSPSTLAVGRASASPKAESGSSQPFTDIAVITQGAPMNLFNTAGNVWEGLDVMPLGIFKLGTNMNAFYPALAQKWTYNKAQSEVTVWLQPNARWSNGQEVTATDVVDTEAIEFALGAAQGFDLGTVKAINSKEVQFTEVPGSNFNLFVNEVLSQEVAPASVYGKLLPKNIWTLIAESEYTGSNAALKAKAKAATGSITVLGKNVAKYAPAKDVSSGPYVISNMNSGEAVLKKNPDFYDASAIKVPEVLLRNYSDSNQQIWNYIIGGQVDQATSGGMTVDLVNQMKRTPGNVFYQVPSYYTTQLVFNEKDAPYNLVKVRQAIAYILNRHVIQKLAEPTAGSYSKWSTNMIDAAAEQWLTPAQQNQLNQYNTNDAMATKLLNEAGLKKVNGSWMLPNGKPWTVDLEAVSGFSDWIEAASVISSELRSFGIGAEPQVAPSYSEYLTELADGKYPVGFWIGSLGPDAYYTMSRLYGTEDGYDLLGGKLVHYAPGASATVQNWLDFPQTVAVKGYGNVNVGVVTNQLDENISQATMHHDMAELAAATNQYLPAISLWNGVQAGFINDTNFTDFPLKNQTVMMAGEGFYPPVGIWEILGYIRPR